MMVLLFRSNFVINLNKIKRIAIDFLFLRCAIEKTTAIENQLDDRFNFEIMAFQFFGNKNNAIKFECVVLFCEPGDVDLKCFQACTRSRRKRRDVSLLDDGKTKTVRTEATATSPLIIVLDQGEFCHIYLNAPTSKF